MVSDIVLVVEDDTSVRQMIEKALEEELGVQTVLAEDGLEAIEVIWNLKPALIVLDLKMPEFDGAEVVKTLKSRPDTQSIPIVAITGVPGGCAKMLAAGVDDCIPKPFAITAFIDTVGKYLRQGKTVG